MILGLHATLTLTSWCDINNS